jgi:hypothetical protein
MRTLMWRRCQRRRPLKKSIGLMSDCVTTALQRACSSAAYFFKSSELVGVVTARPYSTVSR